MNATVTVARSALLDALQRVAIIAGRAKIPIASGVLVECAETGLRMTTTDFDQTISTTVAADMEGATGRFCVSAKALLAIVAQLPAVPVTLAVSGTHGAPNVRVVAGRAAFRLPGLDPSEFPKRPPARTPRSFTLDAGTFVPALTRVAPHTFSGESRPIIEGVCLTSSAEGVDLAATDGHAAHRERVGAAAEHGEWIIPAATVTAVARLFAKSQGVTVTVDDRSIGFGDGITSLVSRVIEGPYPDLPRLYTDALRRQTYTIVADREALTATVKRTTTLPGKLRHVRLDPRGAELVVSAVDHDGASAEDALVCATTGDAFAVCFDPSLLLAVLGSIPTGEVRLGFGTDVSAALISDPACADDFTGALLMPIRDILGKPDTKGARS